MGCSGSKTMGNAYIDRHNNNIENELILNKINNANDNEIQKLFLCENKIKINYKLFDKNYKLLFEDLNALNSLLDNPIDTKKKFDNYAIISKKNFSFCSCQRPNLAQANQECHSDTKLQRISC